MYVCVYIHTHKNIYFIGDFLKHIFDFIKYQQYLSIFPQGGQKLFQSGNKARAEHMDSSSGSEGSISTSLYSGWK